MEGYGYGKWAADSYRERRATDESAIGLTEIDLSSGAVIPRSTLGTIANTVGWSLGLPWHVFVSHPQYSPNGRKLAFFIRRSKPGRRVQTKMCVLDKPSDSLATMESGDWVSHYCWLDDENLLVYLEDAAGRRVFQILSAGHGAASEVEGLPLVDGHPNFSPLQSLLVVDSYSDRRRRQSLSVFQFDGGRRFTLVEEMRFYSPLRFRNENRVDLHPRWDRVGQRICIDSSFSGRRCLTVVKAAMGNRST